MLEQPLAPAAAAFQRELVGALRIDIAADEAVRTVTDAAAVSADRSATVLNVGHSKLGGPTAALQAAQIAHANGVGVMVGSVIEMGIATAMGLHLAAALPRLSYPSYLMGPRKYRQQITEQQVEVVDGCVAVPAGPGIGFTVDERELRRSTPGPGRDRRAHHDHAPRRRRCCGRKRNRRRRIGGRTRCARRIGRVAGQGGRTGPRGLGAGARPVAGTGPALAEFPLAREALELWAEAAAEGDFEFVVGGNLYIRTTAEELPVLQRLVDEAHRAGLTDVELLDADQTRTVIPCATGPFLGAMWSPVDAACQPATATAHYVERAERAGVHLGYGVKVTELLEARWHIAGVHTTAGPIAATRWSSPRRVDHLSGPHGRGHGPGHAGGHV